MATGGRQNRWIYSALVGAALVAALIAGWTSPARQVDNYHYDWTLRLYPPVSAAKEALVLEIDDETLSAYRGPSGIRPMLADVFGALAAAGAKVVALDFILAEGSADPAADQRLARAMAGVPTLVLAADLIPRANLWQEPYAPFRAGAAAVGHVHADQDRYDGVIRQVQLEKVAGKNRHWALALEAFRLARGGDVITESNDDILIGETRFPLPRHGEDGRPMLIRFRRQEIPRLSVKRFLAGETAAVRGKAVFVGVTSQSEARDKWITPYSGATPTPGVEVHAHIFETLVENAIPRPVSNSAIALACFLLAGAAGLIFSAFGGWQAYVLGVAVIAAAHVIPHLAFRGGLVFPLLAPAGAAWLSVLSSAGYRYFTVRRQLLHTEADRRRYQEAIHFVSHEMKSPLTAIQGSSELMTRYNLSEEKRNQIARMINSESKRLSRMIQTFLDVERLSDGQSELKKEPFSMQDVVILCIERARPLAERKRIELQHGELTADEVLGDRELMEYAVYNLLTNAVKYSPPGTMVHVEARREGGQLRVGVRDQGIGMDKEEVKKIGTKFFRTKKAEASGEAGTGIGLSIVARIVEHHGGRMEVTSAPQKGSCFTLVVPAYVPATQ